MVANNLVLIPGAGGVGRAVFDHLRAQDVPVRFMPTPHSTTWRRWSGFEAAVRARGTPWPIPGQRGGSRAQALAIGWRDGRNAKAGLPGPDA